jgi:hypothetical protein
VTDQRRQLWVVTPFPEIPCTICAKPLDLETDLTADENGKAVHQHCYVERITSSQSNPPVTVIAA